MKTKFTKRDLRHGDICVTSEDNFVRFVCREEEKGFVPYGYGGRDVVVSVDEFNDDLTHKKNKSDDIDKVCRGMITTDENGCQSFSTQTIWERN